MAPNDETLEIEMKFPVADFPAFQQRLRQRGGRRVRIRPQQEADHYFNAPDRDFARTDEAVRLRRIGSANFVTYKGPKRDTQTKTRTEIEVALGRGDQVAEDFCRLLRCLGYRDIAVVRKERSLYRITGEAGFQVTVCLDEVEEVGRFVELEILAPASKMEAARAVLMRLAAELGLTHSERRSYLQLLLEKQNAPSVRRP